MNKKGLAIIYIVLGVAIIVILGYFLLFSGNSDDLNINSSNSSLNTNAGDSSNSIGNSEDSSSIDSSTSSAKKDCGTLSSETLGDLMNARVTQKDPAISCMSQNIAKCIVSNMIIEGKDSTPDSILRITESKEDICVISYEFNGVSLTCDFDKGVIEKTRVSSIAKNAEWALSFPYVLLFAIEVGLNIKDKVGEHEIELSINSYEKVKVPCVIKR